MGSIVDLYHLQRPRRGTFHFNHIQRPSTISASFTDNTGGADVGSPRFVSTATNGDFFSVYLGTPPNFNDNDPAAFTTAFSGVNLNNGTNNSAYESTVCTFALRRLNQILRIAVTSSMTSNSSSMAAMARTEHKT